MGKRLNMEYITIILLLITTLLLYRLNYYKEKYQIYYNNYKQCLNALKGYDPKLKACLESKEV
jgi:hypothetical protein